MGSGRSDAHAVAVVPLAHRNTGAVPEAVLGLRLLVLVVPARAEWGTQRRLVLRQPFEHHLPPVVCVRVRACGLAAAGAPGEERTAGMLRSSQYVVPVFLQYELAKPVIALRALSTFSS